MPLDLSKCKPALVEEWNPSWIRTDRGQKLPAEQKNFAVYAWDNELGDLKEIGEVINRGVSTVGRILSRSTVRKRELPDWVFGNGTEPKPDMSESPPPHPASDPGTADVTVAKSAFKPLVRATSSAVPTFAFVAGKSGVRENAPSVFPTPVVRAVSSAGTRSSDEGVSRDTTIVAKETEPNGSVYRRAAISLLLIADDQDVDNKRKIRDIAIDLLRTC